MRQYLVLVLQFHLEHRIRQRLDDHRHYFNRVFLRQTVSRFRPRSYGGACSQTLLRQDHRALLSHGHRVLKMRA